MKSRSDIALIARRRQRLSIDYQIHTNTLLDAHNGRTYHAAKLASRCFKVMRRQFLSHYVTPPPPWRIWIRQLHKERVLPDFCIIGPAKSGTSDLAVTIMSHPNVLYPLIKEFSSRDPLAWRPFYPTIGAVRRHALRHGTALCPLVGPYLHCPDVAILLSSLRPDAKIIIVLRNPVDLMFSMWKWNVLHKEKHFVDRVPFLATFPAYVNKLLETPGPLSSVLQCGIYTSSISDWLQAFGKRNVRIFDIEEYFKDRSVFVPRLEQFLGLPHVSLPPDLPVANRNPLERLAPDPNSSAKLREFFEPYNRRLWDVIGTVYSW